MPEEISTVVQINAFTKPINNILEHCCTHVQNKGHCNQRFSIIYINVSLSILLGARPQRFQEMFQGKPFEPGIKVIPIEETKLSFFIGADKKMKTGIERLELVDRFQDQYLVGNPIVNGM